MKRTILSLILILTSSFFTLSSFAKLPTNFKHIYFFGDSLTDVGNYPGNPTGDYPDEMEDQAAPVTNWESGSQFQGKITWAGLLTKEHYNFTTTPGSATNPQGNDWAVSGATTTQVAGQITQFQHAMGSHYPDPDTTLYVIWAGANDFLALKPGATFADAQKIMFGAMLNIEFSIESLERAILVQYPGKTVNFLVAGMPDISVTPLFTNSVQHDPSIGQNAGLMKLLCSFWNSIFFATEPVHIHWGEINLDVNYPPIYALKLIYGKHINIYSFDTYDLLDNLVNNPQKYHFATPDQFNFTPAEAKKICGDNTCQNNQLEWFFAHWQEKSGQYQYGKQYQNPDIFIFHNSIHPSTHTHQIMADRVIPDSQLYQISSTNTIKDINIKCNSKLCM